MRFIKFPEATAQVVVPGLGPVPFVQVDDKTGLMCVELSEQDVKDIRHNGNKLYVVAPWLPTVMHPMHVILIPTDPFKARMKVDGKKG